MQSFYKDWSGTSPRPDRTTGLVKSSLEHPGGPTKQSCPQDQTGRTIENPGDGINPDHADTKYSQTPLALAAKNGYGGVVKILLKRQDVRTTPLDRQGQTPLSLALSEGRHEVVRILRNNANSHTADPSSQASLPPSAGHGDRSVVDTEPQSHNPNASITDLIAHPPPPPDDHDQQEGVSDLKDHLLKPDDSHPSLVKPSRLPRLRSIKLPKFLHLRRKVNDHPNNIQRTLSFAVDRYFIIASLIVLLAFLVYFFPPSLPHIFSSSI